jgi:hypothetical protein
MKPHRIGTGLGPAKERRDSENHNHSQKRSWVIFEEADT